MGGTGRVRQARICETRRRITPETTRLRSVQINGIQSGAILVAAIHNVWMPAFVDVVVVDVSRMDFMKTMADRENLVVWKNPLTNSGTARWIMMSSVSCVILKGILQRDIYVRGIVGNSQGLIRTHSSHKLSGNIGPMRVAIRGWQVSRLVNIRLWVIDVRQIIRVELILLIIVGIELSDGENGRRRRDLFGGVFGVLLPPRNTGPQSSGGCGGIGAVTGSCGANVGRVWTHTGGRNLQIQICIDKTTELNTIHNKSVNMNSHNPINYYQA